jgi:hypothetical protein
VAQLSTYIFLLTGCSEKFLLEVEATSLADLAQEISCKRFIVGRIKAVDGEATSQGVLLPVPRIALVVEPE